LQNGTGKTVLVLKIEDIIDMGMSAFVIRSIKENSDVSAIIFDINTPGGRIDAATQIRDAIMNIPQKIYSVAFIHPRAISAGAFISFACDYIFISDGGSIGAATPISIEGGKASAVGEKYVSYFRTEMAATARAKGRNGKIAEAMVDKDIEIKGIIVKGKLLTLDTNGAILHKIANDRANSINELLEKLALKNASIKKSSLNWAEKLARIFTHPVLTGILMSIGVLGILIELYHPGFGLPGIVGVTSLLIFFAGHMVVHMAGFEEVLLLILGFILLGVEIFVIPGFGVVGALGILAIAAGLVLSLTALPIGVSFDLGIINSAVFRVSLSILATIIIFIALLWFLPKGRFVRNRLVLTTAITSQVGKGEKEDAMRKIVVPGKRGRAYSVLRPSGIGKFDNIKVDVISEGEFIEKGKDIIVVSTDENKVVVRPCV
jgi:membrane-bound serine protease (ClpP class)